MFSASRLCMVMVVAVRSKGTRVSNVATKVIAVAQMRLQAADTQSWRRSALKLKVLNRSGKANRASIALGTHTGAQQQSRSRALYRGVQPRRYPAYLTSSTQNRSGSVVQSTDGLAQLLYQPLRSHDGKIQGERYATPYSPRNIRESTTGHTSTGSVCTT